MADEMSSPLLLQQDKNLGTMLLTGDEEPLVVAIEQVPVHDIFANIDTDINKKNKRLRTTPKKIPAFDSNGHPVDKRKAAALALAQDIVQRYRDRGNVLPKEWIQRKGNPEREQEYRDKNKLRKWRQSLDGNYKGNICFEEIKNYLDTHMPDWSQGRQSKFRPSLETAQGIIERYYARGSVLPRNHTSILKPLAETSSEQQRHEQAALSIPLSSTSSIDAIEGATGQNYSEITARESQDADTLNRWRMQYNRMVNRKKKVNSRDAANDAALDCVKELLDQHLPNWRDPYVDYGDPNAAVKTPRPRHNVDPMQKASEIVQRYKERGNVLPKEWNDIKGNPERLQEYRDASKLRKWRQAVNGVKSVSTVCPDFIQEYLDEELGNWRQTKSKTRRNNNKDDGSDTTGDKRYQRKRKRENVKGPDEVTELGNQSRVQYHQESSHGLVSQDHMEHSDRDTATFSEAAHVLLSPNHSELHLLSADQHQSHQLLGGNLRGDEHDATDLEGQIVDIRVHEQHQHHHQHDLEHHPHHHHHHHDIDEDQQEQDEDMRQLVHGLSEDIESPSSPLLSEHDNIMTITGNHTDSGSCDKRRRDSYEIMDTVQI